MKIAAHTLGCKLNYAETSDLLRRFSTLGHTIVDFHQAADLYIINTCTVTAVAEKKCRTAIRQAHRLNPEAQVAVIGCFAQVAARDIEAIPGVTLVLGNDRKHLLPQLIEVKGSETGVRGSERTNVEDDTIVPSLPLTPSHSLSLPNFSLQYSSGDRTRTFFKIQDGCDYFCTYCAIPFARGRSRSATIEETLCMARRIADEGAKEVVLTGVNTGTFGQMDRRHPAGTTDTPEPLDRRHLAGTTDTPEPMDRRHLAGTTDTPEPMDRRHPAGTTQPEPMDRRHPAVTTQPEPFLDLLRGLDRIDGILRYRISSIEPNLLTDDIIRFVASSRAFLPHFHIPLQAGSDHVLQLMHRRYDTALYRAKLERIKELMPDACIAADIMAGFNGENEEEFRKTLDFVESLPISYLHVFTYSDRPGTAALRLGEKIPIPVRHEHTARLLELSERKHQAFIQSQLGKTRPVLWESKRVESEEWRVESGERRTKNEERRAENEEQRKENNAAADSPLSTLHSPLSTFMEGWTDNYIRLRRPYDPSLVNTVTLEPITPDNLVRDAAE